MSRPAISWTWSAALLLAGHAAAQSAPPVEALRLTPTWETARAQRWDAPISFTLNRAPLPEDGRFALVVGRADLSALLELNDTRVTLPLRGERLPSGEVEVVAYLVSPAEEWRELGRFPLRRLNRAGFESAALRPRLDLQSERALRNEQPAGTLPAARAQDVALNASLDAALKRSAGEAVAQGLLLGATRETARLRAAQMGGDAPAVDLASYNLRITQRRLGVTAGHIGTGNNRHLLDQFRSRGVSADLQLVRGVQATLTTMAGSEIVGWQDPLGVVRPTHRILSGSLGIEAAPARPGLLRLDLTTIDGSVQPLPAFNQQAITDRQESRGAGAQLSAMLPSGRVRMALGLARSRFANPVDPLLSGDSSLVAVQPETRDARFGEVNIDAVRGLKIGPALARLSLAARHERIDPQYRSVGVGVQADRDQNALEANGALGALQLQFALTRARNNLEDIPSLLTTNTNARSVTAALPVAQLVGAAANAWWWPALTMAWQEVHQAGESMPDNGGFRLAAQVPDQMSSNITAGATWQHGVWNLAVRVGSTLMDNRAEGREKSDFDTGTQGVTLGVNTARLMLAADLARETMHSREFDGHTRNDRVSLQASWRPYSGALLSSGYSISLTNDEAATLRGSNSELRIEAAQGFNLYTRPQDGSQQARVFVRYVLTSAATRSAGELQPGTSLQNVHCGLSFRLF